MKLVPLGDKVVIKQLEAEEKTKSGIVLPSQSKEKPQMATVIAVGPGGMIDGNKVEMTVKAGDKIIYSKYCGTEKNYLLLSRETFLRLLKTNIDCWR